MVLAAESGEWCRTRATLTAQTLYRARSCNKTASQELADAVEICTRDSAHFAGQLRAGPGAINAPFGACRVAESRRGAPSGGHERGARRAPGFPAQCVRRPACDDAVTAD